jgi:uncharacterized beta-barrel protein YwiB (DUF1934 family)
MKEKTRAVMIKMKSVQTVDGESTDLELITEGTLSGDDGKYTVCYKDSEATGFEDCVTSVEVLSNNFATICRDGNAPSNLVLEINKKHHCHYGTPYGDMMVGIYAHRIVNELSDDGGHLYMKYTVDVNSSYVSDNEIIMDIEQI